MASREYQHIRFGVEPNGVATLTFSLPTMANAMDLLGVQETLDALRPARSGGTSARSC